MGVMQLLVYMGPSFAQLATPWGPGCRARGSSPSLWRRGRCLRRCESGSGCSRGRPGAAERARAAGEAAAPAPFAPRPQGWAAGKRSADRQRSGTAEGRALRGVWPTHRRVANRFGTRSS
ncbi:interferon-induced transmembrane protein 10 isoform X2 [Microtus oregoni]|uniref:interferon-induced transmembrane protein 10 isoform X2 n=1 Tax=Microtus oregoni TaxID=111838 RepID=UPI001BB26DD2|nr:interferon-induced transmembrane protein 10 isoform X2 [Microtus oregoni]